MATQAIHITHFVNPNMFYYKPLEEYPYDHRFQTKLDNYCEKQFKLVNNDPRYVPDVGETVAAFKVASNKWCRCTVDEIDGTGHNRTFNLWAIDEGVPLQVKQRYVRPLPQQFHTLDDVTVQQGSVKNVLPMQKLYDRKVGTARSILAKQWSTDTVGILKELLDAAYEIQFNNCASHMLRDIRVHFGDLIIVSDDHTKTYVSDMLQQRNYALLLEPSSFLTKFLEMGALEYRRCPRIMATCKTPSKEPSNTMIQTETSFGDIDENKVEAKRSDTESRNANGQKVRSNPIVQTEQTSFGDIDENKVEARRSDTETRNENVQKSPVEQDVNQTHCTVSNIPRGIARLIRLRQEMAQRSTKEPSEEPTPAHNSTVPNDMLGTTFDREIELASSSFREPHPDTIVQLNLEYAAKKQPPTVKGTLKFAKMLAIATKPPKNVEPVELPTKVTPSKECPEPIAQASPITSAKCAEVATAVQEAVATTSLRVTTSKVDNRTMHAAKPPKTVEPVELPTKATPLNKCPEPIAQASPVISAKCAEVATTVQEAVAITSLRVTTSKVDNRTMLTSTEKCVRSRLHEQRILVHGAGKLVKPAENINSAYLDPLVKSELAKMSWNVTYRLQSYAWPWIIRGNSLFCISAERTGKTYSYLPAVCSRLLLHNADTVDDPLLSGPMAIIVVKSSYEVQRVAAISRRMMDTDSTSNTVIGAYGVHNVPKICNLLMNTCWMLVATAPCYRRLHESMPQAFSRRRIKIVVIDDFDVIKEHYLAELRLLCQNCDKQDIQMIVTAKHWNQMYVGFLKKYCQMLLIIGAFLEAAIYGNTELTLKFIRSNQKLTEMIEYLGVHNYRNERTLIVASTAEEVHEIVSALRTESIIHMTYDETATKEYTDSSKEWDKALSGQMPVLVCYDDILADLDIQNAQHIIHYSLSSSWTRFTQRFSAGFQFYRNILSRSTTGAESNPQPHSMILLDENNNNQLPKLIEFLQIHKSNISEPIVKLANHIRISMEEEKLANGNPVDFCNQLLEFGKCYSSVCRSRHIFTTNDLAGPTMPTAGTVKLKICSIFTPTHYSALITHHRQSAESSWSTVSDSLQFYSLQLGLQQHFANEDHHCIHTELNRNDLCVLKQKFNYWRARIVKFAQGTRTVVTVKLIDTGRMVECEGHELLHLPEKYREQPGYAVDVRIAGVVPLDFELEWVKSCTLSIQSWLDEYTGNDKFHVEGKVLLATRDTIWVDTLFLVEHLSDIKATVNTINIKSEIISNSYGIVDAGPMTLLRQMVENCEAYRYLQESENHVEEDSFSWVEEHEEATGSGAKHQTITEMKEKEEREQTRVEPSKQKATVLESTPEEDESELEFLESDHSAIEKKTVLSETATEASSHILDNFEQLLSQNSGAISATDSSSSIANIEQYVEFEADHVYSVSLSHYFAPDNFYVQDIERAAEVNQHVQTLTDDANNLRSLKTVTTGQYCLVFYDEGYCRAKVTAVKESDITIFFLDLGGYAIFSPSELYELPSELLALPFCAVKGHFAKLLPYSGSSWSQSAANAIYDDVLAYHNPLVMHARVLKPTAAGTDRHVNCHAYEMVLMNAEDSDEDAIIDEIAVRGKFAFIQPPNSETTWPSAIADSIYDDVLENHSPAKMNAKILKAIANDSDPEVICHAYEMLLMDAQDEDNEIILKEILFNKLADSFTKLCNVNFTDDELFDFFFEKVEQDDSAMSRDTKAIPPPAAKITELDEKKKSAANSSKTVAVPKNAPKPPPMLRADYLVPKTYWRQCDTLLVVKATAPDVQTYDLTVSHSTLLLAYNCNDNDYVLAVNLHTHILPQMTTCEVRGLQIVIRMVKLVPVEWPRLTTNSDKRQWLHLVMNDSSTDDECEEDFGKPLTNMHRSNTPTTDSSADEHDEMDDFDPLEDAYFVKN